MDRLEPKTSGGARAYPIAALQRGLALLKLFSNAENGLTASEVVKLSKLPASTVHRFLMNLHAAGFLTFDAARGYHLGVACVTLGQSALSQLDVRRLSMPHLQELNRQTRETIHLTVRHGLTAVYVEKLDSPEPLRIHSRIGKAVPLHSTAVGKVLLAYLPLLEQAEILTQLDLRRFTPNTVGSLQELEAQLRRVRRVGYSVDLEENEPHIRCIAAPVWDHTGMVNASLSITAPAVRMGMSRIRELAPLIQNAGAKISLELGYNSKQAGLPSKNGVALARDSRRQINVHDET
jgi:DNA-binding IclR family transcriptional regulator